MSRFPRKMNWSMALEPIGANLYLFSCDNVCHVIVQLPGKQDNCCFTVDQGKKPAVERLVGACAHALAVLVENDAAPECLAQQNKGCVFQKRDSVAGDCQVADLRAESQQLP